MSLTKLVGILDDVEWRCNGRVDRIVIDPDLDSRPDPSLGAWSYRTLGRPGAWRLELSIGPSIAREALSSPPEAPRGP